MKIIGIGLNKTGTTSLHEAVQMLGFTSLHWGGGHWDDVVHASLMDREPVLSRLPERDAYFDIATLTWPSLLPLIERQYPGSKFIVSVRDMDEWVESRRRHVQRNREARARGEYHGTFLDIDEMDWRNEYDAHYRAIGEHFDWDHPRALWINVCDGDGWGPLCRFLGVPEPDEPFPHLNASEQ